MNDLEKFTIEDLENELTRRKTKARNLLKKIESKNLSEFNKFLKSRGFSYKPNWDEVINGPTIEVEFQSIGLKAKLHLCIASLRGDIALSSSEIVSYKKIPQIKYIATPKVLRPKEEYLKKYLINAIEFDATDFFSVLLADIKDDIKLDVDAHNKIIEAERNAKEIIKEALRKKIFLPY